MASRLPARLAVIGRALLHSLKPRRKPQHPRRILIAHHLLLGDVLMLTALLAKLRQQYPQADIVMACPKAIQPLYQSQPYGVRAITYNPRDPNTIQALQHEPGFDLSIIPGDNRYSWLARALNGGWIIAFAGDRPAYKSWPVDELVPYPSQPSHWSEMVANLIPGPAPATYRTEQWPAPEHRPFELPTQPYCVLHVGASSPLKMWPAARWLQLAAELEKHGYQIVWSGGPNEQKLINSIDPAQRYRSYAERLDLPQLWQLFARASLVVCPDTGVAHLGRLVDTPTLTLFGPGSPVLHGAGEFWRDSPFVALTQAIPCRDQHLLYKRELAWVQRCGRSVHDCPHQTPESACMQALTFAQVWQAACELLLLAPHENSAETLSKDPRHPSR